MTDEIEIAAVEVIDNQPAEKLPQVQPVASTPLALLDRATASGASVETLERLMALYERDMANKAKAAFDAAIAAAKSELPTIVKNREVDFTTQKGRTAYRFEDLHQIASQVDPVLARYGLSYRFRTEQNGQNVTVICIISHRDGYSETTSLSAGADQSGNKNSIQAVGSTVTYLQRYTLKSALGLAVANDTDGVIEDDEPELISAKEAAEIRELIAKAGSKEADVVAFFKSETLEDIPSKAVGKMRQMLQAKIRKLSQEGGAA